MDNAVYLVDAAVAGSTAELGEGASHLWRLIRRFNRPVQLALLAGHRVAASADDPSAAALVSVAPRRGGSPELDRWLESALPRNGKELGPMPRMNPVLTLHVVDNLALSGFAIHFANRAYCLGLGGAPGQAWSALEAVLELLEHGEEHTEAIVMAGDRFGGEKDDGVGTAMLYSRRPRAYRRLGCTVRLLEVVRRRRLSEAAPIPADSCGGLVRWLDALGSRARGPFDFVVPAEDGDALDDVTVRVEVGP